MEDDSETLDDKEYIPLNARHEKTEYFKNNCVIYWSARTGERIDNVQLEGSNTIYRDQRISYTYYVPERHITDTD